MDGTRWRGNQSFHHCLGDVGVSLPNGAQTVCPTSPTSCVGRATGAPQTQPTHVQWETANFPCGGVERLTQKIQKTLPHASVVLVGKLHGLLWVTHQQMAGRTGRGGEEEKEPRRLKVLDRWNATRQQLVGFTSGLELGSDESVAVSKALPNTRIPCSEAGAAWSPNQMWASGSL